MEKPYVFALFDRIMEYSLAVTKEMVRIGADIIWLGDDVGAQDGMLISPVQWRKTLKERLRYIITELKREKPEIQIAYHCCGSYFPIMGELIEAGVDILNALQPTAANMDLATIKNTFSAQASLFGGIDTQQVLPFGSLDDVEEEVQRVMTAAAQAGGYIISGAHNIQPDTSVEKIVKLFEWSKKYGIYPIQEFE
jgi:uroporphyrinogen decarboxylase